MGTRLEFAVEAAVSAGELTRDAFRDEANNGIGLILVEQVEAIYP